MALAFPLAFVALEVYSHLQSSSEKVFPSCDIVGLLVVVLGLAVYRWKHEPDMQAVSSSPNEAAVLAENGGGGAVPVVAEGE